MNLTFPEFDLTGRVALVTGAGKGIGRQVALTLARYGADLIICSRSKSDLVQLSREVADYGRSALIQVADITKKAEVDSMIRAGMDHYKQLDILVNNAGLNIPQWAEEVTEEAWDQILDTNLKASFLCSQSVGRVMIKQKHGKIINMSSQSGSVALLKRTAYCASKAGINLMTKVLAVEWGKYNIQVNAVAPTFIKTPMTGPMLEDQDFHDYVMNNIPLGRMGTVEDVASAVIYLSAPASNMVTGHILLVDGGWTAQ